MTILHFFSFHRITSSYRCRLEVVLGKFWGTHKWRVKWHAEVMRLTTCWGAWLLLMCFHQEHPPPEFWEQNRLLMQIQFRASLLFLPVYHFFLRYKTFFSPTPHWIFALEFRIGIWICCNALSKDTESWCRRSLDSYPWLWMKKLWRWDVVRRASCVPNNFVSLGDMVWKRDLEHVQLVLMVKIINFIF